MLQSIEILAIRSSTRTFPKISLTLDALIPAMRLVSIQKLTRINVKKS